MSAFSYKKGVLHAEDLPLERIAEEVGTPFYCYSTAQLEANYKEFAGELAGLKPSIHYAVKANSNKAVIRTLANCGAGADITSAGELERAIDAGIKPAHIVYSGVGKRREEIAAALLANLFQINVESIPELILISEVAVGLGRKAPVALRINPDVSAHSLKKISTGELGTKFGIDYVQVPEAMKLATTLPGIDFKGFTVHIGSHMNDYEPFRLGYTKVADIVKYWRAEGVKVERLDLGGGVGISYDGETLPPFREYAAIVKETVGDLGCALAFEPGRRLVGNAGVLVARVLYVKQGAARRFVVVDAGMNDLVRPAMYGARHSIVVVREKGGKDGLADVVGPVCETSDIFGKDYNLPGVAAGDLVAILQAGAYGAAMSCAYNGRPLVPEILVAGAQSAIVRRRIAVAEQIGWEGLPQWLAP